MIVGVDKYFEAFTIQRQQLGEDSYGNPIEGWEDHKQGMGRLRMLSGSEQFQNGKDIGISTHRLYTRELDIELSDRIIYGGVAYNVLMVNNVMSFDELNQVDLELVSHG